MTDLLLVILTVLAVAIVVLQVIAIRKKTEVDLSPIQRDMKSVEDSYERLERSLRDEFAQNRNENSANEHRSREELNRTLMGISDSLHQQLTALSQTNSQKHEGMREVLETRLQSIQEDNTEKLERVRADSISAAKSLREEVGASLKGFNESMVGSIGEMGRLQKDQLQVFADRLDKVTQSMDAQMNAIRQTVESRLVAMQESNIARLDKMGEESELAARKVREEVGSSLKGFNESMVGSIGEMGRLQKEQLQVFADRLDKVTQSTDAQMNAIRQTVESRLVAMQESNILRLDKMGEESELATKKVREEVTSSLKDFNSSFVATLNEMGVNQRRELKAIVDTLMQLTEATEKKLESQRVAVDARLKEIQTDTQASARQLRDEIGAALKGFNDSVLKTMTGLGEVQKREMDGLKASVEKRLAELQEDNAKQLERMRATVDEKLQGTLERRLGESFKQVSERLEQVYKGLGEMQNLATGVGDLKKVLTNVKTRGTWGEVQLGAMLEQVLNPDQFAFNVATKEGGERVEFAIKLPGRDGDREEVVWLPIDAKFPVEDYQRLIEAQERGDPSAAEVAGKQLENRVKACAADISRKYVNPPNTTDFGILFLPIEGLFAEVIRRPGLTDAVQRDHRVVIAGPTTLWSILNSLQMGFRTLAIQQRSSEVWQLLAAVKTEWSKYGDVLTKVQKKLQEASNTVDDATRRTRAIGRKLKNVQELPATEAGAVLMLDSTPAESDDDEAET